MHLFFLVVGMEIGREIHDGALSKLDQAVLPVIAAAGGIIVAALIYLNLSADPVRGRGWDTHCQISPVGVLALLARISHTKKFIGAPNQRKLLCCNDFQLI